MTCTVYPCNPADSAVIVPAQVDAVNTEKDVYALRATLLLAVSQYQIDIAAAMELTDAPCGTLQRKPPYTAPQSALDTYTAALAALAL